jgi:urea transport system substrate-binding protein
LLWWLKVAGEEYVPLDGTDFSAVIAKVQAASPDAIYSTLNGDSNVSFFKQMAVAGCRSRRSIRLCHARRCKAAA